MCEPILLHCATYGIGDCCGRVLLSIYSAKVSRAQLVDMPLRRVRASPSPYRAYSSYQAEEKASFS